MKACTKCDETKPLSQYFRDSGKRDGLRSECKACNRAAQAEYLSRPEIRESRAKAQKEYYERPDVDERRREARKEYLARPETQKRMAEYMAENRHIWWENTYLKRVRKFGHEPSLKRFTLEELVNRYGNLCVDCGGEWEEVDHVIPVRLGGEHSIDNCQPVCRECNLNRWLVYQREAYDLIADIYGRAA